MVRGETHSPDLIAVDIIVSLFFGPVLCRMIVNWLQNGTPPSGWSDILQAILAMYFLARVIIRIVRRVWPSAPQACLRFESDGVHLSDHTETASRIPWHDVPTIDLRLVRRRVAHAATPMLKRWALRFAPEHRTLATGLSTAVEQFFFPGRQQRGPRGECLTSGILEFRFNARAEDADTLYRDICALRDRAREASS